MPRPFVKWVGGKTQLLGKLHEQLPSTFNQYVEPFVGGGALFFSVNPEKALLADSNGELINAYQVVRDNLNELIESLKDYLNEENYFYNIRSVNPLTLNPVERASRFIYLNKTCYNGLYRVNKKNEFNSPYGRYKNPTICDKGVLRSSSLALQGTALQATYFQNTLEEVADNSFVYMDPPYLPIGKQGFTGYSKKGFDLQDHELLADYFDSLSKRGVKCLLSNSDTEWARTRYQDYKVVEINARRSINSDGAGRGEVKELMILNY